MSILKRNSPVFPKGNPGDLKYSHTGQRLAITVVFTTTRATLEALRRAGELAHELGAEIRILAPQLSPYPLPLHAPPVDRQHVERQFRTLVPPQAISTRVEILQCRDVNDGICHALQPHSLVVICGRQRWWPTKEQRLTQLLRRGGHQVVFVPEKQKDQKS